MSIRRIFLIELTGNSFRELAGGEADRLDLADERHGDGAGVIDLHRRLAQFGNTEHVDGEGVEA